MLITRRRIRRTRCARAVGGQAAACQTPPYDSHTIAADSRARPSTGTESWTTAARFFSNPPPPLRWRPSQAAAAAARKASPRPASSSCATRRTSACSRNTRAPDPIAQLEFMAAQGFTALEDNGLMGRPGRAAAAHRRDARAARHDHGRVRHRRRRQLEDLARHRRGGVPREVPRDLPHRCRSGQTRQCALGHRGAGLFRTQAADRHPDRARRRHAARRRRDSRASQPDHGARAALRQPGPVPAHLGPGVRHLPRGR